MADVRPFKGLRPKKELVEKVATPPYDVLSSDEAREKVKGNPYDFLYVTKPEVDLEKGINLYDEKVYKKAAENFKKFIKNKILIQDNEDYYYVYKQIMGSQSQIGFVAVSSVAEYEHEKIKKHELTREAKEIDRTKHILSLNAQAGPVFLVYKSINGLNSILENVSSKEPEYDFESEDGVRHIFWVVRDKQLINDIKNNFKSIPKLYIADGHHRSAAASRVKKEKKKNNSNHNGDEEYNYFLTVIFPHDQMNIMAYNRVIKDLNNLDIDSFFKKVKANFNIEKTDKQKPEKKHEIIMYINKNWYKLMPKPRTFDEKDPVDNLDVHILQNNLIDPILGIKNVRKDQRIDFIGGIRGTGYIKKLVDNNKFKVGFSLHPTSINDLINVADADRIMPPKSTWFEPKLRSGIIIHLLD